MNYYNILGISENANEDEIKKAYRKLAVKYHPDVNNGDKETEDKFKEISEAYDTLGNPDKKKSYDNMLKYGKNSFNPGSGKFQDFGGFNEFNPEDIFSALFGFQKDNSIGRDLNINLEVPLRTAVLGDEIKLTLNNNGVNKDIKIKIPSGVFTNQKLRVRNEGGVGSKRNGDLIITIIVAEDEYFTRQGNNLLLHLPVSMLEVLRGDTIDVPTVNGEIVKVKLKRSLQNNDRLKIKNLGLKNKKYGDLILVVNIYLMEEITDKQAKGLIDILSDTSDPKYRDQLISKINR